MVGTAATQGAPVAQYRLAALYEKGVGVAQGRALARAWYLKAANAGNARAMHNLAVLDARGRRRRKARLCGSRDGSAAPGELGVRDSQYNLGVLYGRGLGLPQDLGQSWIWFSLAAQQGDADAGKKRDEVAAKMDAGRARGGARRRWPNSRSRRPTPRSTRRSPQPAAGTPSRARLRRRIPRPLRRRPLTAETPRRGICLFPRRSVFANLPDWALGWIVRG